MKKGWYILNYHNISWEENQFVRGIGGTFSPHDFRTHVTLLKEGFKLMSVGEAYKLYKSDNIDVPILSFWFDDGFVGNRKYAFPILEKENIKAAISINSRFLLRTEMFWRFKLSYIHFNDGDRFLRSKMRNRGIKIHKNLKDQTFEHFSDALLKDIDSIYSEMTTLNFRNDAFRIFDTIDGIHLLKDNGWMVTNHSAAHYPISESSYMHHFLNQFEESEQVLKKEFNIKNNFWVLPFDRKKSTKLGGIINKLDKEIVCVGNKINKLNFNSNRLYRINITGLYGAELISYLNKID